jgi:hypothetical protein
MPNFLFWNVSGNPVQQLITQIAFSNEVDVLILAECDIDPVSLTQALNQKAPVYAFAPGQCKKLLFFTRFSSAFLKATYETSRISIRRLNLPGRNELIIVGAHLPSKMQFSGDSQVTECSDLSSLIKQQEGFAGHSRTVVLGDLHVNPFESGMVGTGGLHAVMSREVASKGQRVVQEKQYAFFYNPMWGHFGDRTDEPAGTYYYEKAEHVNYFWNIFDQVLLRPDVLHGFDTDGLRIVTRVGAQSLLDQNGKPDKKNASDHLPVLLTLRF